MTPALRRTLLLSALIGSAFAAADDLRAQASVGPLPLVLPSNVHVTDGRLRSALARLLSGSPTARGVLDALITGELPVAIGTPTDLASLLESESGSGAVERAAVLGHIGDRSGEAPQEAWVVVRVHPERGRRPPVVERVWVVVNADRIEQLIGAYVPDDLGARLLDDLTIALGHELVAHVGSIARTRKLSDFCDDPVPGAAPTNQLACSLRVENQVRKELNENLHLEGARRFPERKSYGLESLFFGGRDVPRAMKLP